MARLAWISTKLARMEGQYQSKGAPTLKDAKAFQGAGHVNRTHPHDCPDGPLPMEASLHVPQDWLAARA